MRVLVIEDDADVASYIVKALDEAGHNATHAETGKQGLFLAATEDYDVLVVDRMLPAPDGLAIIRTLRASENRTPAIILSALSEIDDRVKGLKAGGDDYLTKPFAASELLARIEAVTRRLATAGISPATRLAVADLEMDFWPELSLAPERKSNYSPESFACSSISCVMRVTLSPAQ